MEYLGLDSIQLQAQITGLNIVLCVVAMLQPLFLDVHCFPEL